jgi:hypothetical protein
MAIRKDVAKVRIQSQILTVMDGERTLSTLQIHARLKSRWKHVPRATALARYLSKNLRVRRVGATTPATWELKKTS